MRKRRFALVAAVLPFTLVVLALPASGQEHDDRERIERSLEIRKKQLRREALTPEEEEFWRNEQEQRSRMQRIREKQQRGESLTAGEAAHWEKMLEQRRRGLQRFAEEHPPRPSTGLVPLPDLETGTYQGFEGGLYPGGRNTPPKEHLQEGLRRAKQIQPLDAEGNRSSDGSIVLVSLGMSNTTQEFQAFQKLASEQGGVNPRLLIVDGAQGGQAANVTWDPEARFWEVVDARLKMAGATPKQVQVVWMKQAVAGPIYSFPRSTTKLQEFLRANVQIMAERFPNLKIAYLSSRIYAGYATTPLNPEPYAYEGGFAVKWLIEEQIKGNPELNYDPGKGRVRAPWLAWGPYLWADGTKGRRQDRLVWLREDLVADGTHPSPSGRQKVGELLLHFLKTDPTARSWFLRQ
jgi:hypothetical protein